MTPPRPIHGLCVHPPDSRRSGVTPSRPATSTSKCSPRTQSGGRARLHRTPCATTKLCVPRCGGLLLPGFGSWLEILEEAPAEIPAVTKLAGNSAPGFGSWHGPRNM